MYADICKAPHVFAEKLLSSFGSGWSISIDRVPPSADMAASPLQPFLVTVTRCSQQSQLTQETDGQVDDLDDIDTEDGSDLRAGQHRACPEPASAVQLSFQAEAGAANGEQLADIVKVVLRQQLGWQIMAECTPWRGSRGHGSCCYTTWHHS